MSHLKKVWPKLILIGSSSTQYSFSADGCWGSLLANFLQRKCDVINRGFSGYNTRWCNKMIPSILSEFDAKNISMVTVFLGANDSNLPTNKQQHVPLEEFKQNLLEIVEKIQSHGVPREKVVIIGPPASNISAWENDCQINGRVCTKSNTETAKYAKACVEAARESGCCSVDMYTEMVKEKDWENMLNDGLHLSSRGCEYLFDLLKPVVTKVTAELPMLYPDWKQVDTNNPELPFNGK
ncbi:isoamyl acetate-hydrolyzing esterase 1 homolog isoform X1 [Mytilus galloprovincialis]|uniref:isoamyl acetate-hydrolyzing esterase 1 homolog isoform X1 n=1 Tax=Mytilus galloprovincialis TaxID=29158 RepID=UPI003F7C7294